MPDDIAHLLGQIERHLSLLDEAERQVRLIQHRERPRGAVCPVECESCKEELYDSMDAALAALDDVQPIAAPTTIIVPTAVLVRNPTRWWTRLLMFLREGAIMRRRR